MSIDKSLKSRNMLVRKRNVLTRAERLEKLKEKGLWNEGDSIFGLPKVKTFTIARPTRHKAETAETGAAPTPAATEQDTSAASDTG